MSPRLPGASCVLAAVMMLALGVPEASAYPGFGRRAYETVYVPSTASILLEPTAYYLPTSYFDYTPTVYTSTTYLPSSYVVRPTSYLVSPTTYIRPTTYYSPTRYVVRRPLVTTSSSIVERAYYVPTVTTLDLPLIRTSSSLSLCCDDPISSGSLGTVISDEPVYDRPAETPDLDTNTDIPAPASTPSGSQQPASGEPPLDPGVIRSEPRQPSTVRPTDSPPAAAQPVTPLGEPDLPLVDPSDINPPLPPPADEIPLGPGETDSGSERTTLRPTFSRPLAEARSGLLGKIVSAVTGEPEAGVTVTLTSPSDRFRARTATTDANGTFSVILPEGDWTVTIPKPGEAAGASTIDRFITVSGGVITDDQNREVTLMTINR